MSKEGGDALPLPPGAHIHLPSNPQPFYETDDRRRRFHFFSLPFVKFSFSHCSFPVTKHNTRKILSTSTQKLEVFFNCLKHIYLVSLHDIKSARITTRCLRLNSSVTRTHQHNTFKLSSVANNMVSVYVYICLKIFKLLIFYIY